MEVVRKYFQDIKTDIDVVTNPFKKEPAEIEKQRCRSISARIMGGTLVATGIVSLTIAAFSFLGFAPITAVGWATIGVAAVFFGQDLVKIGQNIREKVLQLVKIHTIRNEKAPYIHPHLLQRHATNESEMNMQLQYAEYLTRVQAPIETPTIDILRGTILCKAICNGYHNLQKRIELHQKAVAAVRAAQAAG